MSFSSSGRGFIREDVVIKPTKPHTRLTEQCPLIHQSQDGGPGGDSSIHTCSMQHQLHEWMAASNVHFTLTYVLTLYRTRTTGRGSFSFTHAKRTRLSAHRPRKEKEKKIKETRKAKQPWGEPRGRAGRGLFPLFTQRENSCWLARYVIDLISNQ